MVTICENSEYCPVDRSTLRELDTIGALHIPHPSRVSSHASTAILYGEVTEPRWFTEDDVSKGRVTGDTLLRYYTARYGAYSADQMCARIERERARTHAQAEEEANRDDVEQRGTMPNVFSWTFTALSTWKDRVARALLMCCGNSDIVADWDCDNALRGRVSKCMTETYKQTTGGVTATGIPAIVTAAHLGENDAQASTRVELVPRLVAHAVVALRMKLGRGAMDRNVPGNVAIVQREAAKLLREYNVRSMDAAAHLYDIERAFFEDETHFRVQSWRARACERSRLVRWFIGREPPAFSA